MISQGKIEILRQHILGERADRKKPFAFTPRKRWHMDTLIELQDMELIEISVDEDNVITRTRITPKGALRFLRAVGSAVSKSGREYFRDFINNNPDFVERCGPIQRDRVQKYLVLGHMPPSKADIL
jgi:hypothetical protein